MTNIEAMKLALDALENHAGNYKLTKSEGAKQERAEEALRQSISESEQAKQKPSYKEAIDKSNSARKQATEENKKCREKLGLSENREPITDSVVPWLSHKVNEQAEQEPVGWMDSVGELHKHKLQRDWSPVYTAPPKAEQEPVAWMYRGHLHEVDPSDWAEGEVKPLYTAPPQREWVGLTEDEVEAYEIMGGKSDAMLARAIEAKLKEKNK